MELTHPCSVSWNTDVEGSALRSCRKSPQTAVHCRWACEKVRSLWKAAGQFLKILHVELPQDPAISFLGLYPKESWVLKRYLHTHVQWSVIHYSQKREATHMSTDRWTDKQNAVYTYNGTLLSLKKTGDSDMCYGTDEPWVCYVKWNKPATKRQMLHDATYRRYLELSNL